MHAEIGGHLHAASAEGGDKIAREIIHLGIRTQELHFRPFCVGGSSSQKKNAEKSVMPGWCDLRSELLAETVVEGVREHHGAVRYRCGRVGRAAGATPQNEDGQNGAGDRGDAPQLVGATGAPLKENFVGNRHDEGRP